MEDLRWLLLVAGVVVIAAIYIVGRRSSDDDTGDELSATGERYVPPLDEDDEPEPIETPVIDDAEPIYAESEEPPVAAPQKIVTVRVVARDRENGLFKGDDLVLALRGIGMRHGKFGIFHRLDGDDDDATIFSAASLIEPGSFDLANIRDQQIPGISLFLVLPGPVEGAKAFDMLMEAARALTQGLDGELLDESGSTLSIQRERFMREEIIQFEHSQSVA